MTGPRHLRVGAVVLTHNSSEDLPTCLSGLMAQTGVDLMLIVVDNASRPDDRARMEADFLDALPNGRILATTQASTNEVVPLPAVFLRNEVNGGYSAGNNIGIRLAATMGCDAVLIVNPDVRIVDPGYVAALGALILSDPKTAVTCSALRNLSGAQENPMTEPGFVNEFLWPVEMIFAGLFRLRKTAPPPPDALCRIDKASGACFMIRTEFLQQVGFFDESVFLYCEESILMAQVQAAGWHILMDPSIEALHAHRVGAKGDPLPRFQTWAESRSKFHKSYGGYNTFQQSLLTFSRKITLGLIRVKSASNWLKNK
jgi:GT2 family glycosyltransferase